MDTGRGALTIAPAPAAFEDPRNDLSLDDELWPWESPDIKIDALGGNPPSFQFTEVDDVAFESALAHDSPRRGAVNLAYVQAHNRGKATAQNVKVRLFYTEAGPYPPSLPADFWTALDIPRDADDWKSVGIDVERPILVTEPAVRRFSWIPRFDDPEHYCFLAIADAESIVTANRVADVQNLARRERRAALKNIHLKQISWVDDRARPTWCALNLKASARFQEEIEIRTPAKAGWKIGVLLPKAVNDTVRTEGLYNVRLEADAEWALRSEIGPTEGDYDLTAFRAASDGGMVKLGLPSKDEQILLLVALIPHYRWKSTRIPIVRRVDGSAVGAALLLSVRGNFDL